MCILSSKIPVFTIPMLAWLALVTGERTDGCSVLALKSPVSWVKIAEKHIGPYLLKIFKFTIARIVRKDP